MTSQMSITGRGVPPGWATARIGDILSLSTARVEPGNRIENPELCYIGLEHIERNTGRLIGSGTPADVRSTKSLFRKGDLLYGKLRPYLNKVYLAEFDGMCSTDILVLPKALCYSTKFLKYRLLSADFVRYANRNVSGVQHPRVRPHTLLEFEVSLPPLVEQFRIADKLDELFSKLDAGVAALKRVRENLKRYRASVLKAAVDGRLTEKWRTENTSAEPASKLLDRILQERRRKWDEDQLRKYQDSGKTPPKQWEQRYQEPKAPDPMGLPGLPKGWIWASIDQLIVAATINGISVKGSDSPPGVPALRLNAMTDSGFNYSARRYLPISPEIAGHLQIRTGDFFVSRANGSVHLVGRGTLAQQPPKQIVFPDLMIRLRFADAGGLKEYVNLFWGSRVLRRQVEAKVRTTAGIYKISQRDIEAFVVPIPPLDEQGKIIEEVEHLLSVAQETQVQTDTNCRRATSLRQSILKRAFEGRLIPQDPSDEPAKALLARIRHQREADSATGSGRQPMTREGRRRGAPRHGKRTNADETEYRQLEFPAPAETRRRVK